MAWVPQHYHATTKEVAEAALAKGALKFPGICFIEDGNYTAWVTREGTLDYIGGYNQITGIEYHDGNIYFMAGTEILYEANMAMTPDTEEAIKNEIIENLDLSSYAKSDDVHEWLDNIIGDLGDSTNVVEYVDSRSYDTLMNIPIINLTGTLTSTVTVSDLDEGVYKISGQFRIGGTHQTIQMGSDDSIFIVSKDDENTYVTQLSGNFIKLYTLDSDGNCTTDKYITESYITDQDFISASEVITYVQELVGEGVEAAVIAAIDEQLDARLEAQFSAIADEDIMALF